MPITATPLVALGRNVRSHREKKKLTQEALGELAELHTTYISDIERGVRNPSITSLISLAHALGLTVSELCRGIDP